MRNMKVLFLPIFFIGLINAVLPVKKHSLDVLKERINQDRQEGSVAHVPRTHCKKTKKNSSFLQRTTDFLNNKKKYLINKIRLFYRHHFYLSIAGLGLFSLFLLYYLKQYGVTFVYDLIEQYNERQKSLISVDQTINPAEHSATLVKQSIENEHMQLNNNVTMKDAEKKPIDISQDQKNLDIKSKNEILHEADQFSDQTNEIQKSQDLQVNIKQPAVPIVTEINFKRSTKEINDLKNLYLKTKEFINEKLTAEVDLLKKLKSDYEVAKKQAKESPYNIQLHQSFLKKEQNFNQYKQKTVDLVKEVIQKIDSTDFVNQNLVMKDFDMHDFKEPRKAIISEKRARTFSDAVAYEWYYSNKIDKSENLPLIRENQQIQIHEFAYVYGILNKVLLPFIQSL